LLAGVVRRAPRLDEAAPAQRLQQAAEVAEVEGELAADRGRGAVAVAAQRIEDARLRQRVGAADDARAQHADAAGVEAVEGADGFDVHRGHAAARYLLLSSIAYWGSMASPFDLSGRVALVTGGNGGIGLGMARGLARAGAAVAIAGRDEEKNASALQRLKEFGVKTIAIPADVANETSCRAMVQDTVERLGGLHILVNNAGINIRKAPQDYTLEEWKLVLDTNLTSAFVASQAAYPELRRSAAGKNPGTKIVMVGSMMSLFGASFVAPYGASKGGIVQLTKALAT